MLTRSDEGCSVADYGVPGAYNEEFTPSYYSLVQPFQLMYTAASTSSQITRSRNIPIDTKNSLITMNSRVYNLGVNLTF